MPTTSPDAFPYPVLTDQPNVPRDIKALADRSQALRLAENRSWRQSRPQQDSFASGAMAPLQAMSLDSSAPAGRYRVESIPVISCTVATTGFHRLTFGSLDASGDIRADVTTSASPLFWGDIITHSGGSVTITQSFQVSSGTGTVYTGSRVLVTYLGP